MIDIESLKKHLYDIVGAIYEVHKELGAGLNEYCYQEGLQMQLEEQKTPYHREMTFHPSYHGQPMQATYRVDFLCKEDIIVECKAVDDLTNNMRSQLYNYMRLLKLPCGIIVNFASKTVKVERYFFDKETNEIISVDGHAIHQYR
ncbi:MAG: GxxExxY protein [Muribaculaceae bacterium]|jgi:GxxExxY protein|nr:GxxExxY protein [Muribaculaceae bacterium]